MEISQRKNENFEKNRYYIPQKKAKNMQNSDSSRNSMIFWKRNKKFYLFDFFSKGGTLWCRNGQNGFFQFFKISKFLFPKQLYQDQTDTETNKVMNFGDSCHKTVEMPDCFRLFGPKRAPLSRNRVKHYDTPIRGQRSKVTTMRLP